MLIQARVRHYRLVERRPTRHAIAASQLGQDQLKRTSKYEQHQRTSR